MTAFPISSQTLAATLWPTQGEGRAGLLRNIVLVVLGSLALTVSAKVQVPFWPVPMTLQTLVLQVMAMALGARLGFAAVLLYLAEGALGLPVFAGTPERGIGLAYMMGPTGGYLLGFAVAALAMGWLADKGWDRSMPRTLAAATLGNAIILGMGVAWLGGIVGFEKALAVGLMPFLLASVVKIGLGAALMPAIWQLVSLRRS